jgi:hypothetical protein
VRHDTDAVAAEARCVVLGIFERDLVEEAREAGVDGLVVVEPERQQHGLLQPLIDLPLAVLLFGDARLATVEQRDRLFHGIADLRGRALRAELGAALEGSVDDRRQSGIGHSGNPKGA